MSEERKSAYTCNTSNGGPEDKTRPVRWKSIDCGHITSAGDPDCNGCKFKRTRPTNHHLKTDPDVFKATQCGLKTFEVRKNDRDFCVGDTLELYETVKSHDEMIEGDPVEFTGNVIRVLVTYVLGGYGLKKGWVIMGIQRIGGAS